jgi:hypothetical protein
MIGLFSLPEARGAGQEITMGDEASGEMAGGIGHP